MTTNILGTAHVIAAPGSSLRAHVEVLREITELYVEVRVISGTGGWSRPGKVFGARKSILADFVPAGTEVEPTPANVVSVNGGKVHAPMPGQSNPWPLCRVSQGQRGARYTTTGSPVTCEKCGPDPVRTEAKSEPFTAGIEPITEPVDVGDYMTLLGARQEAWMRRHPAVRLPALYERFILPGEEDLVRLPEHVPAEKPARKPRVYRSAASLRDELLKRMNRVAGTDEVPDRAVANLSPNARSRAARTAGRRRFARMDRDLGKYAALQRRLTALNGRIATAEARENGRG